jgi:hypothetical protein
VLSFEQTDRRKAIYETIHPETVNGENQHTRLRQNGEPSNRFTSETAAMTGKSERSVQREGAMKLGVRIEHDAAARRRTSVVALR